METGSFLSHRKLKTKNGIKATHECSHEGLMKFCWYFFAVFWMISTLNSLQFSSIKQILFNHKEEKVESKKKKENAGRKHMWRTHSICRLTKILLWWGGEQRAQNGALRVAMETQAQMKPASFWVLVWQIPADCDEARLHSFLENSNSVLFFPSSLCAAPIGGNAICCNELMALTAGPLRCCLF